MPGIEPPPEEQRERKEHADSHQACELPVALGDERTVSSGRCECNRSAEETGPDVADLPRRLLDPPPDNPIPGTAAIIP